MPAVYLVGGAVFGVAAYKRATRFTRQNGQGPWGGSPVVWGLVGLLFGLLGYVLLAIAEKNSKKQVQANAAWSPPAYMQSNRYPQQWSPPPPPGPPGPPGPPRPNVGGSDFLPGRR